MSQFDELPEGWLLPALENVAELISGQHILSDDYSSAPQGIPYLTGPADFRDIHPKVSKWTQKPKVFAAINDVLITVKGAGVGKINILNIEKSAISRQLMAIRSTGLFPKYIYFYLKQNFDLLQKLGVGSTVPGIDRKSLLSLKLPLPPLNEQRRIVEKIEALTARSRKARTALDEIPALLDQFRQSVLAAAFRGDLTADWRVQNPDVEPAEALLERIGAGIPNVSDSLPLPNLPNGWEWSTLSEIGQVSGGLTKNSKRNRFSYEFPYLRVANVYSNRLNLEEVKKIKVQESEIERVLLEKGDLLIVEGNGSLDQIGRVALWDGSIEKCLHQNHLIKVRFNPVEISSYALLWLLSERGRRYIMLVAGSTSGLHTLSISKISALPIPIPPEKEQDQIVKRVNVLLKALEEMKHQFAELELHNQQLDQSILAKAFRGELVTQDPNDEPAAVLLDRIRAERERLGSSKKRGKAKA